MCKCHLNVLHFFAPSVSMVVPWLDTCCHPKKLLPSLKCAGHLHESPAHINRTRVNTVHTQWGIQHLWGLGPAVAEVLEPCSVLSNFLPPSLEIMCLSTPCSFTFPCMLIIRLYFKCFSSFPSACDHPLLHLQSL